MSLKYTYTIIRTDPQAKVMEVLYTSAGLPNHMVSAPMPDTEQSLEQIIKQFAPIARWEEGAKEVHVPMIGTSNTLQTESIVLTPKTFENAKAQKLKELAAWRYEKEVSGIQIGNSFIHTDRESQATINNALSSFANGFFTSLDFKTKTGEFVHLTEPELKHIAANVSAHVKECFTMEKNYAISINNATTQEELDMIRFGSVASTTYGNIPTTSI